MMSITGALAQRQQHECWLRAQQQIALCEFHRRCIANYIAYHGCEPHPAMNIRTIYREYDRPWRKTRIPKVPKEKASPEGLALSPP